MKNRGRLGSIHHTSGREVDVEERRQYSHEHTKLERNILTGQDE